MSKYSDVYAEAENVTYRGNTYSLTQDLTRYYNVGDGIDLSCIWAISDVMPKIYYADVDKLVNDFTLFPDQIETNVGLAFYYKPSNVNGLSCLQFGTGSMRSTIKTGTYPKMQIVRNLNSKNIVMGLASGTISVINKQTKETSNLSFKQFIELKNSDNYIVDFNLEIMNKLNFFTF